VGRSSDQLFLEDFTAGQTFRGELRTISDADFASFGVLTGDSHPIHYDPAYAKTTRFGRPIAHGLHLMALTALGALPLSQRVEKSMVALIEQGCRFVKPVCAGDMLRSELTVEETEHKPGRDSGKLRFQVRLLNERDEVILEGHHLYRMRCRPIQQPAIKPT
jgi:3-hydroxybutyryl-CoA dehydratase